MYWNLGPTLLNSIYSCYLLFERENCLICWWVTTNLCVMMKCLKSSYDKVDHISWLDVLKSWSDLAQLPSTAVIFCLRGRIVSYVEEWLHICEGCVAFLDIMWMGLNLICRISKRRGSLTSSVNGLQAHLVRCLCKSWAENVLLGALALSTCLIVLQFHNIF